MYEHDLELERHIAAQGDEAGFSADRIADARADVLASELRRLVGLFGDDASKVGAVDGTEDDYGDLLAEMALLVGLPDDGDVPASRLLQQFDEFADGIIDRAEGPVTMLALYVALAAEFGGKRMPASIRPAELRESVVAVLDEYIEESTHEGEPMSLDDFALYLTNRPIAGEEN